jgi:RNA polymerase sigma-70 factor (ECF subfamily)
VSAHPPILPRISHLADVTRRRRRDRAAMTPPTTLSPGNDADELIAQLDTYRNELRTYCRRVLGSAFEADDAVQEAMVRAWRSFDGFEGRAQPRSWLFRIATNVCVDMIRARRRRQRLVGVGPDAAPRPDAGAVARDEASVGSPGAAPVALVAGDPADAAVTRDQVRLAFLAAGEHLPARQRVVLVLRDVLRWRADEVAELLDTTPASVNSALQRARATLASGPDGNRRELDDEARRLLDEAVDAFNAHDVATLVALLRRDAGLPPGGPAGPVPAVAAVPSQVSVARRAAHPAAVAPHAWARRTARAA